MVCAPCSERGDMMDGGCCAMTDQASVLVFDSGVGGLSVAAEIRALLPGVALCYAADTAFLPYGDKPEALLIERAPALLRRLAQRVRPAVVVIACNTASTVVLPAVRAALSVPVVGVVPAIKPAAGMTRTGVIGLLGTPGTVTRAYTQALIDQFAPDKTVVRYGALDLVELAERKVRGEQIDPRSVGRAQEGLFAGAEGAAIDVVVLACTHFPLIRAELSETAPHPGVRYIDSGPAIARRVAGLLGPAGASPGPADTRPAFFTADPDAKLCAAMAARGFAPIEVIDRAG